MNNVSVLIVNEFTGMDWVIISSVKRSNNRLIIMGCVHVSVT